MTDEAGGFYSAEDADSVPLEKVDVPDARKMEGAFYLWTTDEVRRLLGGASEAFERRFGLVPGGNAPFDPHAEFTGKNILYTARSIADIARDLSMEPGAVAMQLIQSRVVLFKARGGRPRPERDDKVLTAWNGLMIAAAARAGRVLAGGAALDQPTFDDPGARHLRAATRAAEFVQRELWDAERRVLRRRYRQGHVAVDGFAEDYAYFVWGLLELFQASGEARWLQWAIELQDRQDDCSCDERERRLVFDDGERSVGAGAGKGRVRRRRAVGDVGVGDELH